jgi:two-component system, LytTR family, sensor kinase
MLEQWGRHKRHGDKGSARPNARLDGRFAACRSGPLHLTCDSLLVIERLPERPHTDRMQPRRAYVWLTLAAFWSLFGAISGMQIWISMIAHGHSLARVIAYQVLVWDAWIFFCFAIAGLLRRVPLLPSRLLASLIHVLAGCALATLHAVWWVCLILLIRPYDFMNPTTFTDPFVSTAFYQMPLELLLYGLVVFASLGQSYYAKYRERELLAAQLERSLAEARLHALELQIQPHFLFNTLNAISALVRSGQDKQAVGMIAGLSDLLRYALDRAGDQRVALDDEAEMLRRYLEIQRLRFADRLTFEIDVARDVRRGAVPVLLLQPLAENAIRHGIATSAGPGRVRVRAFRDAGTLRIEITNSGRLPPRVERGIGLSNTVARLEQLYGNQQRFELHDSAEGVIATLTIPWSEVA